MTIESALIKFEKDKTNLGWLITSIAEKRRFNLMFFIKVSKSKYAKDDNKTAKINKNDKKYFMFMNKNLFVSKFNIWKKGKFIYFFIP